MYNVTAGDDMEIDLTRLKSGIDEYVDIDETYSFDEEHLKMGDLLELNNVLIKGVITKDNLNNYIIDVNVSGTMVLPCAITLKPVNHQFDTNINGNLEDMLAEINENSKKVGNTIDILPIIWENILMEIPLRVVSEGAENIRFEGKGWKLITEEEKKVNPELEKLKDLL